VSYTNYDGANIVRTCTRKKGYPTEDIASAVAATIRRETGAAIVPYGCGHCGLYHIGGSPSTEEVIDRPRGSHRRGRRSQSSHRRSGRRRIGRYDDDDLFD